MSRRPRAPEQQRTRPGWCWGGPGRRPAGQTGGGQRGVERGRGNKNGTRETAEDVSPEEPHWNSGFIPRPPGPASQPQVGLSQLQSRPDEETGSQGPAGPGGGHLGAQSRLPPPLPWALAGWQKAVASTLGAAGGGGSDKAALRGAGAGTAFWASWSAGPRACLRTQEVLTRVCQPCEPCLLPPHPSV